MHAAQERPALRYATPVGDAAQMLLLRSLLRRTHNSTQVSTHRFGTDTAHRSCCPTSYDQNSTRPVLACSTGLDAAAHGT